MSALSPRKASRPRLPLTFTRTKWFQRPRQGRGLFPCPGGWKLFDVSARFPRPFRWEPRHSTIPQLLGLVAKAPTVSQEEGVGALPFGVVANPLDGECICSGGTLSAPLRATGRRGEAGSDASEPRRIVGGGCLQFLLRLSPSRPRCLTWRMISCAMMRRTTTWWGAGKGTLGLELLSGFRGRGWGERGLSLWNMCSFQPLPVQWQHGFPSSPFPHRARALILQHGGGEGRGGSEGAPERCVSSPSASSVYRGTPGLRGPVLRASSLLPTARAASGTAQRSRPRLCPLGPSLPGPSSAHLNWAGAKCWEKGLKTGGALLLPGLTAKRHLGVSWKHRLISLVRGPFWFKVKVQWRTQSKDRWKKVVELLVWFKEKSWGGGFAFFKLGREGGGL